MSKSDWKDTEVTIELPEDNLSIPIHGERETDPQKIATSAFHNACRLLEDSQKVSDDSALILQAFSSELFLKFIIWETQKKSVRGHDIHELFFELREEEQNELLFSYLKRIAAEKEEPLDDEHLQLWLDKFEDWLSIDALLFETIRYKHEYTTMVYNPGFIHNLAYDLKLLAEKLKTSSKETTT